MISWEALIVGAALGFFASQDWFVAFGFTPVGPWPSTSGNVHFRFHEGFIVLTHCEREKDSSKVEKVWASGSNLKDPVDEKEARWMRVWIGMRDHYPAWGDITILIKSHELNSPAALKRFIANGTAHGKFSRAIDSLNSAEQMTIRQFYPGVDLASLWLLEHGETVMGLPLRLLLTAAARLVDDDAFLVEVGENVAAGGGPELRLGRVRFGREVEGRHGSPAAS